MEALTTERPVAPPIPDHGPVWAEWPISWSAVWVGALSALAAALIIGLAGTALGMHELTPGYRIVRWSTFSLGALLFNVCGAFVSFVIGGWAAAKVSGFRRSDAAMLHGAIAWLVATPLLLVLVALGAGSLFGGWYGGLAGTPAWLAHPAAMDPNAAAALRNAALASCTAILLGLVGAVLGGWMTSEEPMRLPKRAVVGDTEMHRTDRMQSMSSR